MVLSAVACSVYSARYRPRREVAKATLQILRSAVRLRERTQEEEAYEAKQLVHGSIAKPLLPQVHLQREGLYFEIRCFETMIEAAQKQLK